ncbi:MAG: hypothetical protein IT305_22535 [Chloroflexi bacterium]|nr:hypothetical protein [Chloroflexota bacterium]
MLPHLQALQRAVITYLAIGLVVTGLGSAWAGALPGTTWQARAAEAIQRIVTWPRLLPMAARSLDRSLSELPSESQPTLYYLVRGATWHDAVEAQ